MPKKRAKNMPKKRASDDAYDGMDLAEIVAKLQIDYPEPEDSDFTITADLWARMVALADQELREKST